MGDLPQSGGTTTSFNNTPQASIDNYSYIEDLLLADARLYDRATDTLMLDVMANDLGGKAKVLFSIDDGLGNQITDLSTTDLLTNTAFSAWQTTANGNLMRIYNGKIEFQIADGAGGVRDVNSLRAGEMLVDSFTYAIRLGNGTLSWAQVTVNLAGSADAATIEGLAAGAVIEAGVIGVGTSIASGTLTVADADSGEAGFLALASLEGIYGSFTFNAESGAWTYQLDNDRAATQALVQGEQVIETLSVSSLDGSAHQDITVTIAGTNDAPEAANDGVLAVEHETALVIDSATLLANDADVDSTTLVITAVGGATGGLVAIVAGQIVFTPASGFSGEASFQYEVSDGAGGTSSATVLLMVEASACIIGTDGDDVLMGGAGADCIDGGKGNDTLIAFGNDDELHGGEGDDALQAGIGNDLLYGGEGNDNLLGGGGNDQLFGEAGNDTMTGSENDDLIVGGLGADQMRGGMGADVFRFDSIAEFGVGTGNRDVINAFEEGLDTLDFSELGLTAANLSFLSINNGTGTRIEIDYNLDSIIDGELQINGSILDISNVILFG